MENPINSYIVSVKYPVTDEASANIAARSPEDATEGAIKLFEAYGFDGVEVTSVVTAEEFKKSQNVTRQ